MNFPPQSFAGGMLFLGFLSAFTLLLWAICRHLRSRGHGPVLDVIALRIEQFQSEASRFAQNVGLGALAPLRALNSLPLLGSRSQRDALDQIRREVLRQREEQAARERQV